MKKILSFAIAILITVTTLLIPLSAMADSAHVYDAKSVVALAKKQYGKPYVKSTSGPKTFDCIGLVCYVYKQFGIKIPFTTSAFNQNKLSKVGVRIERKDLQPGDVVCYGSASNITHVGIYIGSGIMINAMNESSGVKYCFIDKKAYSANSAKDTKTGKTVTIDGKSYKMGAFTKTLCYGVRIYGADFKAVIADESACVLTGSSCTPAVKVTFGSATLRKGTDYQVTYSNNTKVGTGIAHVVGKGNYKGVSTDVSFKITGFGSPLVKTLKIDLKDAFLPSGTLAKGRPFTVGGKLTANRSITYVQFDVLDRKGKIVFSSDARPDTGSFSLYQLDHELYFSKLSAGKYTYRLYASVAGGSKTWSGSFTIKASDVKGSGLTYPSGTLQKGKTFSCKGTVKSGSSIRKVTLSVYSVNGVMQFSASASPNARQYDVHAFDAKMTFKKLPAGTYIYRVAVTDSNGTVSYLISQSFKVR